MASVSAAAPTNVSANHATFNGTANPGGAGSYAWFEYGPTTAYGSETAHVYVGGGSSNVPLSASVYGLAAGQMYHYRAVLAPGSVPVFGGSLPARLTASAGSVINVSTFAQLKTALATCSFGDIIDLGGNTIDLTYATRGEILYWNRNPGSPFNVTEIRDGVLTGMYLGVYNGSYFRFRNIENRNSVGISGAAAFGFRCEGLGTRSHHIEWVGCYANNSGLSGWMIQEKSDYWQIWDSEAYSTGQGSGSPGQSHAIYAESHSSNCVVANMLMRDWAGYGLHISTDALSGATLTDGLVATAITSINGDKYAASVLYSAASGVQQTNCRLVGIVAQNAPAKLIRVYESLSAGNRMYGCLEYLGGSDPSPDYQIANVAPVYYSGSADVSGVATGNPLLDGGFRPAPGSAVTNIVPSSQYGYLPALDKDGNPRVTADAGAYAT